MNFLIILLLVSFVCARLYQEEEYQELFKDFIVTYKKDYPHDEFHYRFEIFKKNVDFVKIHNTGSHSYTVALNQFSDLSLEEFKKLYLRKKNAKQRNFARFEEGQNQKIPDSIDWSTNKNPLGKSIVNPVRSQGSCGSCWAFAAVSAIEGKCAQNYSPLLLQLSEQELIDCSYQEGNDGCQGGLMDNAFEYAIEHKGLVLRSSYPYFGADNDCSVSLYKHYCPIREFIDIPEKNLFGLLSASSRQIVTVGVQADTMSFQFYKSGIYDDLDCGTELNHGMALVGYGNEDGQLFWKVKNSWGTKWGQFGYMYIARTEDRIGVGTCGIALAASYPEM